ncbi:hypothetical protein UF75_4793 [Desulfosporosinus sp. I2]|uniref:hypothetical protein n=1 Tax=Desulfosporosinus sp. I2 TaxID=1617025 RepID=UPI00061EB7EB|nr:hypothetical protein [Desulfosporosinus sp. I2]KJR44817.1 hypothetical protein UF75_4793 [Desulfosporosinus sp. I2]
MFPKEDKAVLKELGKQVAEIASRTIMTEKKKLWLDHNILRKTRPIVLCDPENGWNEIITDDKIKCKNSVARHWEDFLRKLIFWGNEMNDDFVVMPHFKLPYVYQEIPWGVAGTKKKQTEKKAVTDGGAYHIETVLEDYSQIKDITKPELHVDYETTERLLSIAHEIFDGILEVKLNTVWFWSDGLTDDFVFLRGMEKFMFDFYDQPEAVHQVMELLYKSTMERLDFLEANNLLCLNNNDTYVGSGGIGFIDTLPQESFNGRVRTKDMWGLAESQVTVGVSPDMFGEFIFPYQKKYMERFGLACYGCCEPMDGRIDLLKTVSNLRRVSVSTWANKQIMAEKLKQDYIYSMKPSPSHLAVPVMDQEFVRSEIKEALRITKDNCVELIMKDNHTLGNNPDNLKNWVRIVREEIDSM